MEDENNSARRRSNNTTNTTELLEASARVQSTKTLSIKHGLKPEY